MEQPIIRISVRNLVEFILRSGDIDNRTAGADKDAMLMGGKIHRKIQRQMGAEYHAEVPLKHEVQCNGFVLSVEGDQLEADPAEYVGSDQACGRSCDR